MYKIVESYAPDIDNRYAQNKTGIKKNINLKNKKKLPALMKRFLQYFS